MEVNIYPAKAHLSKLIAAAEAGEEVIIARNGKPAVKLVLAVTEAESKIEPPDRVLGRLKGKLNLPENWEEEFERIGKELEDVMITGSVFPEDDPQGRYC